MRDLSWKLKQWFRKALPFAIVGAVIWGAYKVHKNGTFRYGLKPAIYGVLRHVPILGSRFRHYGGGSSSQRAFSYGGRTYSRPGRVHRRGGKHHRRRHRR